MERIVVGILGTNLHDWTISWDSNKIEASISMDWLHAKVMKCNRSMIDLLFQARMKFDLVYPGLNQKTTK